jgi:predicted RecB family nuclease
MGKRSRRPVSGRMVSASDLAQMGRCERLVVFEHRHGSQRTAQQQQARARGLVEHAQFYREGRAA